MKDLLTPRQVAQAIDMSESSLKRWCDQGLIPTVRTAGGHRRLPINGVLTFLRNSGYRLLHPELLGLPPSTTGGQERKLHGERERLAIALEQGDEQVCTEVVLNLYLAGIPMSTICDDVFSPIFESIASRPGPHEITVYQERRACEICHRVLHEVRRAMPELLPTAPIAVGGSLEGDPYTLASSMIEMVLRENGWRACSLGAMLPFLSLRQAVCDMRPKLVWLNVSAIRDQDTFLTEFDLLAKLAETNDVSLVVGGKAITANLMVNRQFGTRCETFRQLETYAKTLVPPQMAPILDHPENEESDVVSETIAADSTVTHPAE
ncbi:helix-turn-helix domain-containing protein [Planctomicrobium sp. SH527]|uniref:helix-turn-helix domain-containing protein n=1 Tax=Planctomicrobium sp. SH527 TaxID=3448123 RepID=UPI003F5C2C61